VSKHAIRIPARRAGQRVSWTLEVSADVTGEDVVRAKKISRNHTRSKLLKKAMAVRDSRRRMRRRSETVVAPAMPAANLTGAATGRPSGDQALTSLIAQVPSRVLQAASSGALVVIVVAVLVFALLALPHYPPVPTTASPVAVKPRVVRVQLPESEVLAQSDVSPAKTTALSTSQAKTPRAISEKVNKTSDVRVARKSTGESVLPTTSLRPAAKNAFAGETAVIAAPAATTSAAAAASTSNAAAALTPVTITGCLEISVDADRFRLTDTEGTNVPKARSWRSGFLRKRSAPVELLELADPLTAKTYVGRRVVATGVVEDREMRVRSLQPAGPPCDQ
jgi:hypothetical protein